MCIYIYSIWTRILVAPPPNTSLFPYPHIEPCYAQCKRNIAFDSGKAVNAVSMLWNGDRRIVPRRRGFSAFLKSGRQQTRLAHTTWGGRMNAKHTHNIWCEPACQVPDVVGSERRPKLIYTYSDRALDANRTERSRRKCGTRNTKTTTDRPSNDDDKWKTSSNRKKIPNIYKLMFALDTHTKRWFKGVRWAAMGGGY